MPLGEHSHYFSVEKFPHPFSMARILNFFMLEASCLAFLFPGDNITFNFRRILIYLVSSLTPIALSLSLNDGSKNPLRNRNDFVHSCIQFASAKLDATIILFSFHIVNIYICMYLFSFSSTWILRYVNMKDDIHISRDDFKPAEMELVIFSLQ